MNAKPPDKPLCPLCGTPVIFQGLTSVECLGIVNGRTCWNWKPLPKPPLGPVPEWILALKRAK